ncbi:hypothetical protein BH11PSE3_BH11PSE3_29910 [soil metagenome]
MRQTILSVVLDVEPQSARLLSQLIELFKAAQEPPGSVEIWYSDIKKNMPALHFMSMSVFEGAAFDPIFVIEVNFDGPPGPFWAQMEAAFAQDLREMLRCCKRPEDGDGPMYDAVTERLSRYPLAPYLQKRTQGPSVFHQGNRGLGRDQILDEHALFLATRKALAQPDPAVPNPFRGIAAGAIHQKLRGQLLAAFPWLATSAPARISAVDRALDWLKLVLFAFAVLFCLSIPGMAIAPQTPALRFFVLTATLAAVFGIALWRMRAARAGEGVKTSSGGLSVARMSFRNKVILAAGLAIGLLAYLAVATLLCALVVAPVTGQPYGMALWLTFRGILLGLVSVAAIGLGVVVWLRRLERRDPSQDAPPVAPRLMDEMARREDWIPQNHMGSVVLVKPGVLRTALFRAGHLGLGLVLRAIATDGYLGSMRTVHFAHWAFVNNASRLMFFSNFDLSWESYLDDFIEKAHGGLTLAWGSGVGFPPTRFLVIDGASHGRKFKAWARHSMAVSRFWYSAYRDLTVDQIERNTRIANGLRNAMLSEQEAVVWARDL